MLHIYSITCRFYEDHEDINNARAIFERAVLVPYRNVDDLAAVWCAYSDIELRHDNYDEALAVMMRATTG
jgi:pre-mRNA-splicing factor SYF1